MRRILGILAIALLGLLPLTACGGNEKPAQPSGPIFQSITMTVTKDGKIEVSPQKLYADKPTVFVKIRVLTNYDKFNHQIVTLGSKERHNTEGNVQLTSATLDKIEDHSGAFGNNKGKNLYGGVFQNELPLGVYEVLLDGHPTGAIITVAQSTASTPSPAASVTPSSSVSN